MLLAAVVALGLASRAWPLPGVFAEHTGDALYATAAFCLLAGVSPRAGSARLAVGAYAVATAVECSQLLQWPWLVAFRATRPGALLLGQGFQGADLVAYGAGILLALAADVTFLVRSIPGRIEPDRLPHHSTGPRT